MFVQTQKTPNPNSLKFLPGKIISNAESMEFSNKDIVDNHLITNILSINGVESMFLGSDFLSVNKNDVFEAIKRGVPAARIFPTNKQNNKNGRNYKFL